MRENHRTTTTRIAAIATCGGLGMTPIAVGEVSLAQEKIVAGGHSATCVILEDRTITGWGDNSMGQLEIPLALTDGSVRAVAVHSWNSLHFLALTDEGEVFAWGRNTDGQSTVPDNIGVCRDIGAGDAASVVVRADGSMYAWGRPDYHALEVPTNVYDADFVDFGNVHGLFRRADGDIQGWGMNYNGQINIPGTVVTPLDYEASESWSAALKLDGTVAVWGFNTGSYPPIDGCNYCIPKDAVNGIDLATGSYFALLLREDGSIIGWGDNDQGQLNIPSASELGDVVKIAASGDSSLAVRPDGTLIGWGGGTHAQMPKGVRVWIPQDCNDNDQADWRDLRDGLDMDVNDNAVPDSCDCLSDLDYNGEVAVDDILLVIRMWGSAGPTGDANWDGVVNLKDLELVLRDWGLCV